MSINYDVPRYARVYFSWRWGVFCSCSATCSSQCAVSLEQHSTPLQKNKSEVHHRTGHEGPEMGHMYSCTVSLSSALNVGGWSTPRPDTLLPERTLFVLCRRQGGSPGRSVYKVWKKKTVVNFLRQLKGKGLHFVNLWLKIPKVRLVSF
jgi:hypothetical protein